jgi:ABC-type Fe2+-enterobactin transport system substrate-binding protein
MTGDDKSEATIFFLDEVIHELKQSIKKPPTKINLIAYMSSWLNTLQTIKSINE